ncbi:MAG: hypothetical protein AAFQ85_06760, partial [Pseudomonadota bacterium]
MELERHLDRKNQLCDRLFVSRFDREQIKPAPIDDPLPSFHRYVDIRELLIQNEIPIESGPFL